MAALAKDRNTPSREGRIIPGVGVKASAVIYAGALVVMDAGYAKPAVAEANAVVLGRAEDAFDNTGGSDGDGTISVLRGVFAWENVAGAGAVGAVDIGKSAYITDDQTVTKAAAGSTAVGKVLGVDGNGVWVESR